MARQYVGAEALRDGTPLGDLLATNAKDAIVQRAKVERCPAEFWAAVERIRPPLTDD